jgi:sporulation protein YlmC with PRC-barrel domain
MPKLSVQDVLHMPVYTSMGQYLGKVVDVLLDTDDQRIIEIQVRTKGIAGLVQDKLIIHRSQIVSMKEDKITVEDAAAKQPEALEQAGVGG